MSRAAEHRAQGSRPALRNALVVLQLLAIGAGAAILVASSNNGRDDEAADRRARIRSGDAAAVLDELERTTGRAPADDLLRGHALAALGRFDEAVAVWLLAARAGSVDRDVAAGVLARLDDEDPAPSLAVLRAWPDASILDELAHVARAGAWQPRHRAVALLHERGASGRVDLEAFAIRDVLEGDSCGRRRIGLESVRRHARTRAALDALVIARANDDGCLRRLLAPVEATLRVTLGAGEVRRP